MTTIGVAICRFSSKATPPDFPTPTPYRRYAYVRPYRYMPITMLTHVGGLWRTVQRERIAQQCGYVLLCGDNGADFSRYYAVMQLVVGRLWRTSAWATITLATHCPGGPMFNADIEGQWMAATKAAAGYHVGRSAFDAIDPLHVDPQMLILRRLRSRPRQNNGNTYCATAWRQQLPNRPHS